MITFCPSCSNMLTVNRAPPPPPGPEDGIGQKMKGDKIKQALTQAEYLAKEEAMPYRFACRTCPFVMTLPEYGYQETKRFPGKKAEDIIGGEDMWKNVDRTQVQCRDEECDGNEAFFRQVQIRSADEPMTEFYRCCTCGKEWRV